MNKNIPKRVDFDRIVVRAISNGFIVELSTDEEDIEYSCKSFRQVIARLKALGKEYVGEIEE